MAVTISVGEHLYEVSAWGIGTVDLARQEVNVNGYAA